jgi:hypothetical protein
MYDEMGRACSVHVKRDHMGGTTRCWVDIKMSLKELAWRGGA